MPTYDYECPNGHSFEAFQKITDEPVAECPECGAPARRKISGGAGFLFKGGGFYITDYRSEDYKKKASAESGAPSDKEQKPAEGSGSQAGGEAKPGSGSKDTKLPSDG